MTPYIDHKKWFPYSHRCVHGTPNTISRPNGLDFAGLFAACRFRPERIIECGHDLVNQTSTGSNNVYFTKMRLKSQRRKSMYPTAEAMGFIAPFNPLIV